MIQQKTFKSPRGTQYKLTQFGAKRGQQILLQVSKIIAPVLKEAAARGNQINLGDAISTVIDKVDAATLEEICSAFAGECLVSTDGGKSWPVLADMYDDHFAGAYAEWFAWMKGCFEVNYSDFFSEAAAKFRGASATKSEATTKTKES